MAVFGVYIEKETSYEGVAERFGNTYHYQTDFGDAFDDQEVAERLKDAEKNITQNTVAFVGWRTWGPTDGPAADNVIRETGTFNESGSGLNEADMYAENAIVVHWEVQRSPLTNRRRWLFKFIRLCGASDTNWTPAQLRGSDPIDGLFRSQVATYAENVRNFTTLGGSNINLCNEQGDATAEAGSEVVNDYLTTREIKH